VYGLQGKDQAAEAEFATAVAILKDLSQRVGMEAAQQVFLGRSDVRTLLEQGPAGWR
jgi:hypothetical protein